MLRVLKARAEIIAPAFPDAAEMPWAVARKRVGKTYRENRLIKERSENEEG